MSAINWIKMVATKSLTGSRGLGIRSIPSAIEAEAKTGELLAILQQAGLPINQLDDYIRSEADVLKFINIIKNANKPRVIPGTSAEGKAITEKLFGKKGEVVEFPQKRSFKEEIDSMKQSGDLVDEKDMVISDKITDREMFKNSKLNKPTVEGQMEKINRASNRIDEIKKEQAAMYKPKVDTVEETVTYIKTLEPITAMKEANLVIGRKGKYKDLTPEQSKKILQDTEDHIFERDIPDEDFAKGGRAGFYTGGITDIEPNLSDIGHGSDAMMSRTRLMSPGSQATTSTGLNYLLAEDNDNMRIPFNNGLKVDAPNPRILELMLNEKMSYEDAVKEFEKRQKQQPYIDERMGTGPGPILEAAEGGRIGFAGGGGGGGGGRRAFLKFLASIGGGIAGVKSGILGLGGKGAGKKAVTETIKQSAGSGTPPPYFFKLVEKIKTLGDDAPRFATQDRQKVTTYKDYTLTEDVTTGEKTIQRMKMDDDLKYDASEYYGKPVGEETYMNYKPGKGQMDETTKGKTPPDEYTEDTSLIRSDKPAEGEVMDTFDGVSDDILEEVGETIVKKADGGRIGFSGGGIFRAIIAKSAAKKGLKPYEFIKVTNYKGLPPEVRMFISPEEYAQLKLGQEQMYTNFIDMAKTRKEFQKNIEGGKTTPARELFEGMEKTMDEQSFVPKTVTADDIAEMELMVKNRFNKGRKDNAQGGLQTMLGE